MAEYRPVLINLLPADRQRGKRTMPAVLTALGVAVVLGGLGGAYFHELSEYDREVKRHAVLRARSMETTAASQVAAGRDRILPEQLNRKMEQVRKIEEQSPSFINIIGELEKCMPGGLILESINIEAKQLSCKVIVRDYDELVEFTTALRDSPLIREVCVASSELKRGSNEIEFRLTVEWSAVPK